MKLAFFATISIKFRQYICICFLLSTIWQEICHHFPKKKKKRCVWCIEVGFFFYHLIVITHLLSWVLPRPENDYAGFFSLACRDQPKPHFPHLDIKLITLFDFFKGLLLKLCLCVQLVIKIMMAANGIGYANIQPCSKD